MPITDEQNQKMHEAVVALATKAKEETNADGAVSWAVAARNVAEAYAWLRDTSQPH